MLTFLIRLRGFAAQRGAAVLVLGLFAALAYAGHRTGWKAPRFSELFGKDAGETEDWCESHNVPDSKCIACHPELGGGDARDWCKEHGVPESKCAVCHPEILTKGQASDWCREHGVPESQCTLCHPEIAVRGTIPGADPPRAVTADPPSKPAADPSACQTHAIRVQFASTEAIRKAGVGLQAVEERPMADFITANGEIDYDQTRVARLSARAPGAVWRVEKEVGAAVRQGEILALVDAAEVGRAKSEFLQALALVDLKGKALARIQASAKEGYRSQVDLQEAEAALRESRIGLFNAQQALINLGLPLLVEEMAGLSEEKAAEQIRLLGLPEAIRKGLDPRATTANLIPVTAPFDGVVVAREAVAGEVVEGSSPLFVLADLRRMWVLLDVQSEDAGNIALAQTAVFRPDGGLEPAVVGPVTWISTAVDEKTRIVRVRAEVLNPDGRLRAHTFGTARVVIRKSPKAVAVPDAAIQWEGCCHVVFVRLTDEIFQTRKVRLGARSGGWTEILAGVLPGEVVATTGSHVLKSDIRKSNLGAGCVDD